MFADFFCLIHPKEWKIEYGTFQTQKGVIPREETDR